MLTCDESCEVYKKERKEAELKLAEEKRKKKEEEAAALLLRGSKNKPAKTQERTSRKWKHGEDKKGSGMGIYFLLLLGMIATLCVLLLYFLY